MTPKIDLFNQPVWNGTTNATNYMGTCRMIINDYKRQQYATEKKD